MRKIIAPLFLLIGLLLPALSLAQVNLANLPPNTVVGRLGIPSQGGAAQAIPYVSIWNTGCTANSFTSTSPGCVPASGGGTTNFLRADGTFADPCNALFGTSVHGCVAASGGGTTNFLRADGSWAVPATTSLPSIASGHLIANGTAGTTAAADTAPSTWWDQAFCNSVGQLVTRISGAWICARGIPVNLAWWGVNNGNSAATNSANIATALATCGACSYLLPAQNHIQFSSTIVLTDKMQLRCEGILSLIEMTSANTNIVEFNGGGDQTISNCQFGYSGSGTTQSGTQAIYVNGSHNFVVDRVVISGGYIGILVDGNNSFIGHINDVEIGSTSNTGIVVGGAGEPADIHIKNTHVTAAGGYGVGCVWAGGIQILNSDLLQNSQGLALIPGNGQVCTAVQVTNTYLDSSVNNNLRIAPTGTGKVTSSSFNGVWFASGNGAGGTTGTGVSIVGNGTTGGIVFSGCTILNNYDGGFYVDSADHVTLTGSLIISNNQGNNSINGVKITNSTHVAVVGNVVGSSATMISNLFNQAVGVSIDATNDYVIYLGNDTAVGNTTGASIGAITHLVNADNL